MLPFPSFRDSPADPGLVEAGRLLAEGKLAAGLGELNRLKAKRVPLLNVDYLRAIYFLGDDQPAVAIEALREELRYFPDNQLATAALKALLADKPSAESGDEEFRALVSIIRPYTMVGEGRLLSLFT
jgi:O-methyltransferase